MTETLCDTYSHLQCPTNQAFNENLTDYLAMGLLTDQYISSANVTVHE